MKRKKAPVYIDALRIDDFAAEGSCLGHHNGKVIFVERTVPGDLVSVYLYKNKKDWASGYPVEFLEYAPTRIEPACKHFGLCGGCQWQMVPYEQQLSFKQKQVADNLERIARIPLPEVMPIIGCSNVYEYRNKIEYTFATRRYIPEAEFRAMLEAGEDPRKPANCAGYHAKGVFDKVVAIDHCHLQAEPSNAIRNGLTAFATSHAMPFYDLYHHTGWLRNMQVRITVAGQVMLNIIIAYEQAAWQQLVEDYLLNNFATITTLLFTVNGKRNDTIYDLTPKTVFGNGYITEYLGAYQFRISPKSFFQTNSIQAKKLYDVTRDFAALTGTETVYDLYCGTGSIGIYCSDGAKKIIGVELIEEAIQDARVNANINNVQHAHFFTGDVIDICNTTFFEEHGKPDVIITDPPRAGMHGALVDKLLEIEAPRIVYVSCNPATQARDLALLNEKYLVSQIQPVDMFPHTHHIENVVQVHLR